MDRRDLQDELNRVNELYHQYDLELKKAGGSDSQRQALRDMLNNKKERLIQEMGDSLQQLNVGSSINIGKGTISKPLEQTGLPDMAKQVNLGKFGKTFKTLGKKAAGIIPFAGAGMAALSGDPAMAAEELIEDATGPLAAFKPESAGSAEEDSMIRAERDAQKNYMNSPAYRAARGIPEPDVLDQDSEEIKKPKQTKKEMFSKLRSLFGA